WLAKQPFNSFDYEKVVKSMQHFVSSEKAIRPGRFYWIERTKEKPKSDLIVQDTVIRAYFLDALTVSRAPP
ncbi:unnamed protein product, partial [Orchesella dallaii]